jgi:hypothetical protein
MSYMVNTSGVVTCRVAERLDGGRRSALFWPSSKSERGSSILAEVRGSSGRTDDRGISINTLPLTTIALAPKLLTYPVSFSQRGVCAVDP